MEGYGWATSAIKSAESYIILSKNETIYKVLRIKSIEHKKRSGKNGWITRIFSDTNRNPSCDYRDYRIVFRCDL